MNKESWVGWVTKSAFLDPIIRLTEEYGAIYDVIRIASFMMGVTIIIWTIVSFLQRKRQSGLQGDNGAGTRLGWGLIGGSMMIQLYGVMQAFSGSMWTHSDLPTAMQYGQQAAESTADPIKAGLYAALGLLVLIGWILGLRSCYHLSQVGARIGHGDGTSMFWSAFTSLIFSSALVNMMWVADSLSRTFTDSTFSTTFSL